jgi:AcrR family transcriptional regulator
MASRAADSSDPDFRLDSALGATFSRLPPGRHNLPPEFVRSYQRQRIIAAMIDTVDRCGPIALPVAHVVKAAGISRATFYQHFSSCDEAFDAACDEAFDYLFDPFCEAFAAPGPWVGRLNAALGALLAGLAKEPRLGKLCLIHSQARQNDRRTYRRAVDTVAEALRAARPATASAEELPLLGEELLAGGAIALIAARLGGEQGEGLEELGPQLTRLLAAPLELEATDWAAAAAV